LREDLESSKKNERKGSDLQEREKKEEGRSTQIGNLKTNDIPAKESANIYRKIIMISVCMIYGALGTPN